MSFNGSGTFTLVAGNPVVTGTVISSTWANSTLSDLATGLTTAICKDGQTTPTANLPMGTFKHTGAGSATASGQYLVYGQSNASLGSTTFTGTTAMSGAAFNFASEVDVASATTTDIGGAASNSIRITGTTTITSFGTTYTGARFIRFAGALTLTHNASSLILPGGASITTAAGDTCIAMPLPSSAGWYVQNYTKASGAALTSSVDNSINDFRLTLTSGTPVTTTDVTGATNVYLSPYKGNRIALYDGSSTWSIYTSAEITQALGTVTSGRPYDVFAYNNSGTVATEILAWTSTTARATALVLQDGVLVKSGATTRRYLGTFYTTSTTTTADAVATRYLWNYYNRVDRTMQGTFSAARSNNSTTYAELNSEIRLQFVVGYSEDPIMFGMCGSIGVNAACATGSAVAIDSTSTPTTGLEFTGYGDSSNDAGCVGAGYAPPQAVGFHYATMLGRIRSGALTSLWRAANGTTTNETKVYLNGSIKA